MNDDLTTRLTGELEDRAHAMDGSTLHLADVTGRARSIRRRRTATAVVGAVAAVGLIVPTAALASHSGGSPEPAPATQSTQLPSPSATTQSGSQPAPGVLDVSHLPTGAAPQVDYVEDGTLHFADGGTGRLTTRYTPYAFVELDDGSRVWLTASHGSFYVEIQDDGGVHAPIPSGGTDLVVNPSHTIAAWRSPQNQVMVFEGRATQPHTLGDPLPGTEARLAAVTGQACALACTVYANVPDPAKGWLPWEVTGSSTQVLNDGGFATVDDVSESGLFVGETSVRDAGSCSQLSGGGEFQGFHTCKNSFVSFSPDGRLILAQPSYVDGLGPGAIGMYDLDGNRLFERSSTARAQAFYTGAVWEDDTHVLAPVHQDGTWALVRIGSDGSMAYAVAPVKGDMTRSPFVLPGVR